MRPHALLPIANRLATKSGAGRATRTQSVPGDDAGQAAGHQRDDIDEDHRQRHAPRRGQVERLELRLVLAQDLDVVEVFAKPVQQRANGAPQEVIEWTSPFELASASRR